MQGHGSDRSEPHRARVMLYATLFVLLPDRRCVLLLHECKHGTCVSKRSDSRTFDCYDVIILQRGHRAIKMCGVRLQSREFYHDLGIL
jgi:hypothetical protein